MIVATYGRICVAWHEPCATGQLLLLPLTHSIHRVFCNMLLLLVFSFFSSFARHLSLSVCWSESPSPLLNQFRRCCWSILASRGRRNSTKKLQKKKQKEMHLNPVRQRKVTGFCFAVFAACLAWEGENTFLNIWTAHTRAIANHRNHSFVIHFASSSSYCNIINYKIRIAHNGLFFFFRCAADSERTNYCILMYSVYAGTWDYR